MICSASRKSAIAALGVLAIVLASPARAQQAWDQAAVTGIAQQLATDGDAWEQAMRRQPGETIGSGEAEDVDSALGKSRLIREQSRALAAHLAKGEGQDKTKNLFRDLKEVVDDTQVKLEGTDLDEPSAAVWAKVKGGVNQLAPYYGVKPQEP